MHHTRPGIVRFALPLLIVMLLCTACGANRPADQPFFPTATPPATPTAALTVPPTRTATAPRLIRPTSTQPTSFPCATPEPNPACDALRATERAKPTAPPLSAYTLSLVVEDKTASIRSLRAGTLRALVTGPESPFCADEQWDLGDGKPQWRTTRLCIPYEPLIATPTTPVTREYTRDFAYDRPGTYHVVFCLDAAYQGKRCATTTIRVG